MEGHRVNGPGSIGRVDVTIQELPPDPGVVRTALAGVTVANELDVGMVLMDYLHHAVVPSNVFGASDLIQKVDLVQHLQEAPRTCIVVPRVVIPTGNVRQNEPETVVNLSFSFSS